MNLGARYGLSYGINEIKFFFFFFFCFFFLIHLLNCGCLPLTKIMVTEHDMNGNFFFFFFFFFFFTKVTK